MTANSKAIGMQRRKIVLQWTITQSSCHVLWINNCLQTCERNQCSLVSRILILSALNYKKWVQLDVQFKESINLNESKERTSVWSHVPFQGSTTPKAVWFTTVSSPLRSSSLSAKQLQWPFRLEWWRTKQHSPIRKYEWPWNTAPKSNCRGYDRAEITPSNTIKF